MNNPPGELASKLFERTFSSSTPVQALLEVTRSCDLSCIHCYLPRAAAGRPEKPELSGAHWEKIMAELAGMGCLSLIFTGGEPFLREDFLGLVEYASEKDFEIRIFSSGRHLDARMAGRIAACKVSAVEMSLYGNPEIHDGITGVRGSHDGTINAARLLRERRVNVKFKTPVMNVNFNELAYVKRTAAEMDAGFSFDTVITPGENGDAGPLNCRMSREQLREVFTSEKIIFNPGPCADPRIPCSAGRNVCAVNAYGEVYPCLQIPVVLGNAVNEGMSVIWHKNPWLAAWRGRSEYTSGKCADCAEDGFCERCPGLAMLEGGDICGPYRQACMTAGVKKEIAMRGSLESEESTA